MDDFDEGDIMRDYDLADVVRRRAAGESWAEIGSAYGRSRASAATWFQKHKGASTSSTPRATRARASTSSSSSSTATVETPTPGVVDEASSTSSTTDDPFEEPVRAPAAAETSSTSEPSSTTSGPVASTLGEDAARAYLPLLFGVMDSLAGAGAVWLVRRKLGEAATTELLLQARTLATLHDAEKVALESALVRRLATIELTPDEALFFTVTAIYAAKALAVASIEAARGSEPITLQVA